MAKARKGKNEDQHKADNSEAVVKHQKLCLSIDMEKRRIYGYTVLEIVIPEDGIVGLHADNLAIESVTVDGVEAKFEVFPHYVNLDSGDRWCSVSTATSAADAAGSVYLSSLEKELVPNLLIMCNKCCESDTEQQEMEVDNGLQPQDEVKQNVRMVRIEYWVEKAETGIHFDGNVLHTDNQMRRSRCWFPCMDENSQYCSYDLEFTVAHNLVAVSTGTLLYQVLSSDDPPRKTYVYQLSIPVAARWISLTVAPFEILSDRHNGMLSHICLPSNLSKLQNTMGFFHSAFSHYEEYLCASFPFGSYSQVFIPPEMAISSLSLGVSMCIFSSQLLFDEKVIDQTINTRIKLAYALARQWFGVYITPEAPNDDWLLDGLAEFLTDSFIKRSLGNNEARYRRYKANSAVCKADDSGATVLSSSASYKDLYGTQCIGFYGKIRSWKSVAVLQMLEKQMGPESFRKILQTILLRAQDASRSLRTLSTKEFRHFANKIGNLERPFLKEFFPRWVESSGCPVLRMGFSYNKRKNMVEMAVIRGCTATPDTVSAISNGNLNSEKREGDVGWPGMMSIRVHELDGMYDHPILPLAGDSWQLLEIQCHAKLAARRVQKPRKGSRPDGSDDNGEPTPALDTRSNSDSPLLWLRADPEMEYLAQIHFNQPVQMWMNQLEKDKDVVAQVQAISMLEALPQHTFSVINALNSFLTDSKAFWRIRVEAAFALAKTASEETDWAGLFHLIKFYKSRRFDTNIGLPKPNDFRDFQEYFVLEVIPLAIATVRTTDKRSPREAVEFILQLLKYNDNNGNPYSDVFWLAALVESVGELEFGLQNITYLSSLLKRLDRLLQFDRLMPSYNGILTISSIRSLTQIALKLSAYFPLDRVVNLVKQFHAHNVMLQVKVEAGRALLDLEFQSKGIDAALMLFIKYLKDESSLRGQVKLGVHVLRLCQIKSGSNSGDDVKSETLVTLLHLLENPVSFNNVILRHYLFSILQVLAGRIPTLYGVPREGTLRMGHVEMFTELKNIFVALLKHSKPPEHALDQLGAVQEDGTGNPEAVQCEEVVLDTHVGIPGASADLPDALVISEAQEKRDALANILQQPDFMEQLADTNKVLPEASKGIEAKSLESRGHSEADQSNENSIIAEASNKSLAPSNCNDKLKLVIDKPVLPDVSSVPEASKELATVPNGQERKKPVVRIKVRRAATSSKAEDPDNVTAGKSHEGHTNIDHGASSSVSVDAPQKNIPVTLSASTHNLHNLGAVNSYHEGVSRVTASIGSVKSCADGDELSKELQCTADSSKVSQVERNESTADEDNSDMVATKYLSLQSLSVTGPHADIGTQVKVKKKKTKDVDKKRKRDGHKSNRDDPEYKEKKRLKKEKKRKEKALAKHMNEEVKVSPSPELQKTLGRLKGEVAAGSSGGGKVGHVDDRQRTEEIEPRAAGNTGEGNVPSGEVNSKKEVVPGNVQQNSAAGGETSGTKVVIKRSSNNADAPPPPNSSSNMRSGNNVDAPLPPPPSSSSNKIRIKLKSRTLDKH